MICFIGTSHAPKTLTAAALAKGCEITKDPTLASLVFISEDTPTDETGNRDLGLIRALVRQAVKRTSAPIVLTSQVPPGFTRSLGVPIYCMAETLRIKDAMERALNPEQFIVGAPLPNFIPQALWDYCGKFGSVSVHIVTYEEAEFAKIAINMFLAAQVDTTNRLAGAAKKVGADWKVIAEVLKRDRRIGQHAYLEPGRWQDSTHLMRDYVTLEEILAR